MLKVRVRHPSAVTENLKLLLTIIQRGAGGSSLFNIRRVLTTLETSTIGYYSDVEGVAQGIPQDEYAVVLPYSSFLSLIWGRVLTVNLSYTNMC